MHRRALISWAPYLLALSACGGATSQAPDPRVVELRNAQARVEGTWRFMSFEPERPLGPPFDSLVSEQFGKLDLQLAAGTLSARGAGFQTTRRYEVTQATGDAAQAAVIDDTGVRYEFDLFFEGNQLRFVSKSSPWRGQGALQRVQ
ncbi:MAG TPA: hypothetical protein VI197_08625 [Polyangiaceae bacterium]